MAVSDSFCTFDDHILKEAISWARWSHSRHVSDYKMFRITNYVTYQIAKMACVLNDSRNLAIFKLFSCCCFFMFFFIFCVSLWTTSLILTRYCKKIIIISNSFEYVHLTSRRISAKQRQDLFLVLSCQCLMNGRTSTSITMVFDSKTVTTCYVNHGLYFLSLAYTVCRMGL